MTINDILPRSGMRARLPAPLPARITIVTHGACGETRWPARRSGSANFWQHLSRKEKNSIARKFRGRFKFDRCNVQTRCFANFLDVR
jgi:hypothetical protein